jgi:hypothetical protein
VAVDRLKLVAVDRLSLIGYREPVFALLIFTIM